MYMSAITWSRFIIQSTAQGFQECNHPGWKPYALCVNCDCRSFATMKRRLGYWHDHKQKEFITIVSHRYHNNMMKHIPLNQWDQKGIRFICFLCVILVPESDNICDKSYAYNGLYFIIILSLYYGANTKTNITAACFRNVFICFNLTMAIPQS